MCLLCGIRVNISVQFFFQKITSFNPLTMILNKKSLDGNNFEDWKTNLYIVLDYEKIKFVLNTPKPNVPAADANDKAKAEYAN